MSSTWLCSSYSGRSNVECSRQLGKGCNQIALDESDILCAGCEAERMRMEGKEKKEGRRDESGRRCVGPIIPYKRISAAPLFRKH